MSRRKEIRYLKQTARILMLCEHYGTQYLKAGKGDPRSRQTVRARRDVYRDLLSRVTHLLIIRYTALPKRQDLTGHLHQVITRLSCVMFGRELTLWRSIKTCESHGHALARLHAGRVSDPKVTQFFHDLQRMLAAEETAVPIPSDYLAAGFE